MIEPSVASELSLFFQHQTRGLACVYLFGSTARGQARSDSDLDIAVLYEEAPEATLDGMGFGLAGELERVVGRTVDLVVLNRAPVDLVHRVLRDGVLVHEGSASKRVRFEVRARAAYFDLMPCLKQYRQNPGKPGR